MKAIIRVTSVSQRGQLPRIRVRVFGPYATLAKAEAGMLGRPTDDFADGATWAIVDLEDQIENMTPVQFAEGEAAYERVPRGRI